MLLLKSPALILPWTREGRKEIIFTLPLITLRTLFKQEAQISVTGWSHLKDYIEDFCVNRFQHNATKGKAALEEVLDRVYAETCEQITDIIRDVTGIPLQYSDETASPAPEPNTFDHRNLTFIN